MKISQLPQMMLAVALLTPGLVSAEPALKVNVFDVCSDWIDGALKDPASRQPVSGGSLPPLQGQGPDQRHIWISFRAKNSYGAYARSTIRCVVPVNLGGKSDSANITRSDLVVMQYLQTEVRSLDALVRVGRLSPQGALGLAKSGIPVYVTSEGLAPTALTGPEQPY